MVETSRTHHNFSLLRIVVMDGYLILALPGNNKINIFSHAIKWGREY